MAECVMADETGFGSGLKYFNQHGSQFEDKGQTASAHNLKTAVEYLKGC